MQTLLLLAAICFLPSASLASEDASPAATAQRLFEAMSKHDADAARALFAPDARLVSVHSDGTVVVVSTDKWLEHLGASKDKWLERMWNSKVLEHRSIAVVWGEYDFHLNGNFHHCGLDSFDLVKTQAGWKIAGVMFTSETIDCSPSPLGPPAK